MADARTTVFLDADSLATASANTTPVWFGADFFDLDAGVFQPPSFGPTPADYRLGVGDEVVVDVWGEVELRLTRIIDRDGTIILPQAGQVICAGLTVAELDQAIREKLARSHGGIGRDASDQDAKSFLQVGLGRLRPIRVFVVGVAERPGSYELNSVSTVLTALYAAGGPAAGGSMRHVRLMRDGQQVVELDLFGYLLGGDRSGDERLREGDTIYIPDRALGVRIEGSVRRPMNYELRPGETAADLVRFAGGFTAEAAIARLQVRRILLPAERRPGQPDLVVLDIRLDPETGAVVEPGDGLLRDGDVVTVDVVSERIDQWIEIRGQAKRPGRYQLQPGMTVADALAAAGGLWPDALDEWASIDRTSPAGELFTLTVPLADLLAGQVPSVPLQSRDVIIVFSKWGTRDRPRVHISGEVYSPLSILFREGMTLRDLVLRAGGLKHGANPLRAEIARIRRTAVADPDTASRPLQTVDVLQIEMGDDILDDPDSPLLEAWDRVAIRQLPWWETQQTVYLVGEVFFPGEFSLERKGEHLSSVINRAGGLKPTAYPIGARVMRSKDGVGNIAIDLGRALAEPGSQFDIILETGDRIIVPHRMYTVKVTGEVGFPTSLVHEQGKNIDFYVLSAGGYLRNADKNRTRVVHPNGRSLPNQGGSQVIAGSTIIVPLKPPPEGRSNLEIAKDITAIVAGLATVWLIVDSTR